MCDEIVYDRNSSKAAADDEQVAECTELAKLAVDLDATALATLAGMPCRGC